MTDDGGDFYKKNKHLFGCDSIDEQALPSFKAAMEENYSQKLPITFSNALESIAPPSDRPIFKTKNIINTHRLLDTEAREGLTDSRFSTTSPDFYVSSVSTSLHPFY